MALGSYTGETAVAKSAAGSNACWAWTGDVPGTLREKANADLEALRRVAGKSIDAFTWDVGMWAEGTKVRNPNYWAAAVDLTCVSPAYFITNTPQGGCDHRTATAVTRRHVIGADHYHVAPGEGRLQFYDGESRLVTRGISKGASIGTDLWLGMLDEDLPEGIEPARILRTNDWDKLAAVFPAGAERRTWAPHSESATNRMSRLEALHMRAGSYRSVWLDVEGMTQPDASGQWTVRAWTNAGPYGTSSRYANTNRPFIGGDSGSPVLLWLDGQTVVAETLSEAGGRGPNVSALAGAVEAQIRAWGGTGETNLYWCDLGKWPHRAAEESEDE